MSVLCELCHVAILPRDLRFSTEGGDLHATCAQANGLTQKMPNPGSDEAVAQSCTCPVYDNGRGRGVGIGLPDEDGV